MQNKKLVILIVLGIAAIFSLVYGIFTPAKTRRGISPGQGIPDERENQPAKMPVSIQRRAKRTTFTSWGRNPFLAKSVSAISGLTGILWDEKQPKAIIGDAVVGIGEKVGSNTVVDIKPDKVILSDGTKNFELKLEQ